MELQRFPVLGLSDMEAVNFNVGETIVTVLAIICRKSHTSVSSYDQHVYDVPSYIYSWNVTTSLFDQLQVHCIPLDHHLRSGWTHDNGPKASVFLSSEVTRVMLADPDLGCKQVLGETFRSIPSRMLIPGRLPNVVPPGLEHYRTSIIDHNMLRAFCLPDCKLSDDNKTYAVKFLRGATGLNSEWQFY